MFPPIVIVTDSLKRMEEFKNNERYLIVATRPHLILEFKEMGYLNTRDLGQYQTGRFHDYNDLYRHYEAEVLKGSGLAEKEEALSWENFRQTLMSALAPIYFLRDTLSSLAQKEGAHEFILKVQDPESKLNFQMAVNELHEKNLIRILSS
ncbi:MAG: hypothetical protein HYZ85_01365 [Candidatus Omnitrophica bacterium]|nr:hypothetical protein [Candidatus Omnitrophota bacterium]